MRLFPSWDRSSVDNTFVRSEFLLSKEIAKESAENGQNDYVTFPPLEKVMQNMDIPKEFMDLFLFLFILDLKERLSAAMAPASGESQALERAALMGLADYKLT